ncbi:putative RNA-directed DNA polymerase from transposon BS [Fusarium oxysporum f. sp. cubense]|uniref:Putative RNA-directed DNA polymerase from transposon BS n=1 Tax=Fusarium oxysporum f. sp. cubense TaxID=61366 RepID=A0A559LI13_FUSOC|nr:putative RNA-directed DNA polymerase from transposon BS [Fusarium oxysporum f. sp. cubense]
MASSSTNPPAAPDPFDLGIHTPANLNRGARAILLRDSPAVVNTPIGVSHGPERTAQTPSSPLNAATFATATEGAERTNPPLIFEQQPISIIESANELARERVEEYNAKLMVFQAFCAKFEEAAQQFTNGPQRRFAQQFADSFLDSWKRELSGDMPTSKPTYSSVAASHPSDRARPAQQHQQQQRRRSDPPHRQGQQTTVAPPRQDLRVFVRLEAGAPARDHSSYAIRTLIQEKLGTVSDKIRQVFQVRSGWAILTADSETRDFLVEKQAEWAAELGATAVETNKEWHTYVVSDFPRRLTDFRGNKVDSDSVVSDEIEIQTGLKPVDIRTGRQLSDNPLTKTLLVSFLKPTKKRLWSLFGSRAARLIDKTDVPKQCETCWGYHFARNCHRQPVCQRCGKTGHIVDDCAAWEQCVNCLGPHEASLRNCPARPKRVRGILRRLTKEQREHIRMVGAETYRQRHLNPQPESLTEIQQSTTELPRDDIALDQQSNARTPSPAASGAPSCIMVATAPRTGYEAEEEPEHPRPGSPRKRRINDKKPLKVFQANVGKIPPAHDCALALADTERYDIVLLQEPWTAHTKDRCLTKTHPAYDVFTPVDTWNSNDTRPRVMTYVRRDPRLLADQIRPFETRDILWITINGMTIVNFYRQNDERDALNTLLRWPVPERCLVAGDFNARHHSWQTGQATNRGQEIADWALEQELSLLNTLDIPTNPYGNTIDLAFTNLPLAEATVEDHLATSSDHFTLSLTFPEIRSTTTQSAKIRVTTEDEVKRFVEIVELGATEIPVTDSTPKELDELASSLVNLLTSAVKAAGRPARRGGRPAPWWTEECADAAAAFRAVRRSYPLGFNQDVQTAKRDLHRVVRRAKRKYWRDLIDSFSSSSAVFKAVRWLKSPGAFQPPPLQVDNVVYETQMDKANALRQATLERRTAEDDITNPWMPVTPRRPIPFPSETSMEEVQYATLSTGNTSPGSDNITVKLLEAVWHIIGTHVRRLFERCLTTGHHPKPFKEAEVVMIAKPGRRDLTEPRAWRPISLLSCLGKGLERLIARRLAWAAVHYSVLHSQQAGALPKRSATDLVTALIHDIEEAFARKKVATLVTMDVQGAFDTVMCNRLVLRLREQGWPDHLARWAGSFMSGRSARVRYQDTVTASSPLQCGLPQGSPVSPILFLLYTEPIYRLGNPRGRFGYADDTAILSIGDTVDETTAMASNSIAEMVRWGAANGVSFDTKKTEVMHFSRSKLRTAPAVRHGDAEKHPESALRWLGIWLDSRLSFRLHVEKWAAKAKAVAYHLRGLTNTIHGPLPSAVRSAVRACVEPVLLHGSEAWYPGRTRPRWNQPTKDLPSSNQHLVQIMAKAMNQAMRAILPVWKTTPTAILHRESGIPPVDQLLEARRLRFSARLKSLDEAHPLAGRTRPPRRPHQPTYHDLIKRRYQTQTENAFRTRLRRTDELLASCTRPKLVQRYFHKEQIPSLQIASKEKSADAFIRWVESLDSLTLVVYSDGSLSSEGVASYGFTIHQNNVPIFDGSGRLGPAEVFDAEATGALEGLKAALNLRDAATQNIFICLDNLAAATCLRGTPSGSSQNVFLEFQALTTSHGAIQVRWVPGHSNIPGNEQADKLAKAASSLPEPEDSQPTLAYLRRIARQKPKEAFETWWSTSAPEQYKRLNLKATTGCPPELSLPRAALHHLLAARSLHGDFAVYHERFNHDDARLVCSCGRRKAPDHIFYCRKIPPRHRMRLVPSSNTAVNLATGRDFTKFVDLFKDSSFFGRICPRY